MDFIQSSNKAVDLFGSGKHGFGAGNPTTGVLATFFSSVWANNVQQEIVNTIEGAGIEINPAVQNQLLAAIEALILDPFIGANQLIAGSGFQRLPGGLMFQWGTAVAGSPDAGTSSFPTAFPTACFAVIPVHLGTDPSVNIILVDAGAATFRMKTDYAPNPVTTRYIAVGF